MLKPIENIENVNLIEMYTYKNFNNVYTVLTKKEII